ncbi:hypothetical protein HK102_003300 [Quaeritorhiza haematococci]|nr:hypothetical protein HK102_003300 [Quaeritorhiza haematococci]
MMRLNWISAFLVVLLAVLNSQSLFANAQTDGVVLAADPAPAPPAAAAVAATGTTDPSATAGANATATPASTAATTPGTSKAPPSTCADKCQESMSIVSKCQEPNTPTADKQWVDTAVKVALCVCPAFNSTAGTRCLSCLLVGPSSSSPSTTLFRDLQTNCQTGAYQAVANIVLDIFGVNVRASSQDIPLTSTPTQTPKSAATAKAPRSLGALYLLSIASALLSFVMFL